MVTWLCFYLQPPLIGIWVSLSFLCFWQKIALSILFMLWNLYLYDLFHPWWTQRATNHIEAVHCHIDSLLSIIVLYLCLHFFQYKVEMLLSFLFILSYIAKHKHQCFVQLIYRPDTGEILGVHILGLHAADLIHEASNAIALGTRIQVISWCCRFFIKKQYINQEFWKSWNSYRYRPMFHGIWNQQYWTCHIGNVGRIS